jgi:hypothetical protein
MMRRRIHGSFKQIYTGRILALRLGFNFIILHTILGGSGTSQDDKIPVVVRFSELTGKYQVHTPAKRWWGGNNTIVSVPSLIV